MREITVHKDTKMMITELLPKDVIESIRSSLYEDSINAAYAALDALADLDDPVKSSVITFEPEKDVLRIKDSINNICKTKEYHAVVYLGEMILDPMLSDILIKTTDYIEQLRILNPGGICLNRYLSDWIDPITGKLIIPDIRYLENYKAL